MSSFDNNWFYKKLKTLNPENELDLSDWFNTAKGPRWRGLNDLNWLEEKSIPVIKKIAKRLPMLFADEMYYLLDKLFCITRKIHPCFETVFRHHMYAEALLYADLNKDKYREHFIHPFKVAVLSRWLLDKSKKINIIAEHLQENESIKKLLNSLCLPGNVFKAADYKIIKCALWLAGLFHDIGYFYKSYISINTYSTTLNPICLKWTS